MYHNLQNEEFLNLSVFDLQGREIRSLVSAQKQAGQHQVVWDGRNERGISVPSGVYFYKITAGEFSATCKMTLVK